jgi:hypothetical protein
MFTVPTVLILGAGSSAVLDYPCGSKLVGDIINTIHNDLFPGRFGKLEYFRDMPLCKRLANELINHKPSSIDFFLTQITGDRELTSEAKFFIANEILKHEDINHFNQKRSWFYDLKEAILYNVRSSDDLTTSLSNLKIITFNYDVSLDFFLYSQLSNSKKYFDKSVHPKLLADSICHVYGQLGRFSWQTPPNNERVDVYGLSKDPHMYYQLAEAWNSNILVIGEKEINNEQHVILARNWLEKSEALYLLGYGFHESNNNLLQLFDKSSNARRIYFTTYGLYAATIPILEGSFSKHRKLSVNRNTSIDAYIPEVVYESNKLEEIIVHSHFFLHPIS